MLGIAGHTKYYKVFHYFPAAYCDLHDDYSNITQTLRRAYLQLTVKAGRTAMERDHVGAIRYVAMKRRSIMFFRRQIQSPSTAIPFLEATACLSPVLMSARASFCGR